MKRRKSIASQAASISAWCAVFDWLSIVAALSVERHGPARSSAARRKTARARATACATRPDARRGRRRSRARHAGGALCRRPRARARGDGASRPRTWCPSRPARRRSPSGCGPARTTSGRVAAFSSPRSGDPGSVALDRLVDGGRWAEDAGGAHRGDCIVDRVRVARHLYTVDGWGAGELWHEDGVVVQHELAGRPRGRDDGRVRSEPEAIRRPASPRIWLCARAAPGEVPRVVRRRRSRPRVGDTVPGGAGGCRALDPVGRGRLLRRAGGARRAARRGAGGGDVLRRESLRARRPRAIASSRPTGSAATAPPASELKRRLLELEGVVL